MVTNQAVIENYLMALLYQILAMTIGRLFGHLAPKTEKNRRQKPILPAHRLICLLVLDVSPSMLERDWPPNRLEAAKRAAKVYARRLARDRPYAHVAVIGYGGRARVVCPPTPATDIETIEQCIDRLRVIGSTSVTAGLKRAEETCQTAMYVDQELVVLSDGHHNTGPDPRAVAKRLKRAAVISCVGIGGTPNDVDTQLMKAIASEYPDGSKRYPDGLETLKVWLSTFAIWPEG